MSGRLTKEVMARLAAGTGTPSDVFERQWAEFEEFRGLVESSADKIGIARPSQAFSEFGKAMLTAKILGEFEALEVFVHGW